MPTLADELLAEVRDALGGRRPPSVRALHLPPTPTPGRKDGEFAALELADGSVGLGYVLLGDTLPALHRLAAAERSSGRAAPFAGADALALAEAWRGEDPAQQALGLAALNALSRHCLDRAGVVPPPATDSLGGLHPRALEHVGMVGLFPPLLAPLRASGARLTVLEKRADFAGRRDGVDVVLDPAALRDCDAILCTATTLLNHTLDAVLDACRSARAFVLVGPGAGCLPGPLFRRGVTVVAGTWVVDPAALVHALARGDAWGGFTRKFAWPRELGAWPRAASPASAAAIDTPPRA